MACGRKEGAASGKRCATGELKPWMPAVHGFIAGRSRAFSANDRFRRILAVDARSNEGLLTQAIADAYPKRLSVREGGGAQAKTLALPPFVVDSPSTAVRHPSLKALI
jgi:hypothetical protein